MSSVVEYLTCKCGGVLIEEFDCNSCLTSTFCCKCGEFHEEIPRVDENGRGIYETIEKDGETFNCLTFDVKEGGGFGTLKIGCLTETLESKEDGLKRLEELKNNPPQGVDMRDCFLYLHDKESNTGTVVWGEDKPLEDCLWDDEGDVEYEDTDSHEETSNKLDELIAKDEEPLNCGIILDATDLPF